MKHLTKLIQYRISSFGVIGSGQMGTGIAIVANNVAKLPVTIYDSNQIALGKAKDFVEGWLKKEESKGKLTAKDAEEFRGRMKYIKEID